jgi:hypothetical protein
VLNEHLIGEGIGRNSTFEDIISQKEILNAKALLEKPSESPDSQPN